MWKGWQLEGNMEGGNPFTDLVDHSFSQQTFADPSYPPAGEKGAVHRLLGGSWICVYEMVWKARPWTVLHTHSTDHKASRLK